VEAEVAIADVESLELVQDGVVVSSPVVGKAPDALSRVAVAGDTHVVSTWAISAMFAAETPSPVTAQGSVNLIFVEAATGRRLRVRDSAGRILSSSTTTSNGSFQITLQLGYDEDYATGGESGKSLIYGFASVMLSLLISYSSL